MGDNMQVSYGLQAELQFNGMSQSVRAAIEKLNDVINELHADGVSVEELAGTSDPNRIRISVSIPDTIMRQQYVVMLDEAIKALAVYAISGAPVEYCYEGKAGVMYVGPNQQSKREAMVLHNTSAVVNELRATNADIGEYQEDIIALFKVLVSPKPVTAVIGMYRDTRQMGEFFVQGTPEQVSKLMTAYLVMLADGGKPMPGLPSSSTFNSMLFETPYDVLRRIRLFEQPTIQATDIEEYLKR